MITIPDTMPARQAMLDDMLDDRSVAPLHREIRREAAEMTIESTGGVPCATMTEAATVIVANLRRMMESRVPAGPARLQFLTGALRQARNMRTAAGVPFIEVVEAIEQMIHEEGGVK